MNEHVSVTKRQSFTKTANKVASSYLPRAWREKGFWWTGALFMITFLVVVSVLGVIWSR